MFSEPAKSTEQCPRQNGFFAHPDLSICDVFYTCIEGEATESRCPPGLHFDEEQGVCVWPESAKREGCRDANSSEKQILPFLYLRADSLHYL